MIADPPDVVDLLSTSQPGSPTSSSSSPPTFGDYRKESVVRILKSRIRVVERVLPGVNLSRGRRGTIRGTVNARGGAELFRPSVNRPRRQHRVAIGRHRYSSDRVEANKTGKYSKVFQVLFKEAVSGFIMGGFLGMIVFFLSLAWEGISPLVGLVVAISLPLVSVWANVLASRSAVVRREVGF